MADDKPAWAGNDNPFEDASVKASPTSAVPADEAPPTWLSTPPPPPDMTPQPGSGGSVAPTGAPAAWMGGAVARASEEMARDYANKQMAQAKKDLGDMPKLWKAMRIWNFVNLIFMALAAILTFLQSNITVTQVVLSLYILIFCNLLCCFEMHVKGISVHIATWVGFLYNSKGRVLFMLLVGILMFSLKNAWGYISGSSILAAGCFQFYVVHKHPEWEMQMKAHDLTVEAAEI